MKLYTSHRAPNPRRVLFFAHEKGLLDAMDLEEIDIIQGAHLSDDFRRISPFSQLPALVLDDGRVLTESRAICLYLDTLKAEPALFGADPVTRAFVEMWDRRMELMLFGPAAMWVRHSHPAFTVVEGQIPAYAERSRERVESMCVWLDGHLTERPYITGADFTVADITAVVGLDFAKLAKFRTPAETYPNLARWRERVSARPAAAVGV